MIKNCRAIGYGYTLQRDRLGGGDVVRLASLQNEDLRLPLKAFDFEMQRRPKSNTKRILRI